MGVLRGLWVDLCLAVEDSGFFWIGAYAWRGCLASTVLYFLLLKVEVRRWI